MGLLQIGISSLAAVLAGRFTHGSLRTYALFVLSVLAVYWFQPLVPLRSFDFWLPSISLALVILVWLVVAPDVSWRAPRNLGGLGIIFGLVTIIELSRYILPDPLLTATTPPPLASYLLFVVVLAAMIGALTRLAPNPRWMITSLVVLLIGILVVLKTPQLSLQASIFFRALANRPIESATPFDLRWLGISYIAFRLIHVLRDKQTGRLPALALPEFVTYVLFFPALAAGPIDRVERFAKDLNDRAAVGEHETLMGGQRIFLGLFKKFVVADTLALIALNDALAIQVRTTGWMWIVLYAYTFQIYFDFSGYTDIAIGIARLVGIKLPENFASPYLRPNLSQFWNSWHMTLTQWFRSYFFNPFNRWMRGLKGIPVWGMILIGQAATMSLIGLWHGVTLNFILWGLWHGLGLFVQNRWSDFVRLGYPAGQQKPGVQAALHLGGILVTFHFVALGWVFFALSNLALAEEVFMKLFSLGGVR